ncbi:ImmA/IrrE family metallo-endopeptidase [Maricaulis sp.]|uniref:ImmA/IrrE family metallo-endopeptidase n=1 Tax=Maricaulis sp. TaxID=1486257 RepID=UPI003A941D72
MMEHNIWTRVSSAEKVTLAQHLTTAPVSIGSIAESLGLILRGATLPAGISGEIRRFEDAPAGYIIRINRHEARTRQRFTAAHELSHYLLHRPLIGDGLTDDVLYRSGLSNRQEAEANRLAAEILMPRKLIEFARSKISDVEDNEMIEALAQQFVVSPDAMRIRLDQ